MDTKAHGSAVGESKTPANVFICFANEERDFVRDLDNLLRKSRRISAIDWEKGDASTGDSSEWLSQLQTSETVLFIVSPSSTQSQQCLNQLEHASRLRKVIVPVLRSEVAESALPKGLRSLSLIDYREHVDRVKAFEAVIRAVNTNLRLDAFICYSRADSRFANQLFEGLSATGRNVWMDLKSIPTSALWQREIFSGIEAADNFIFIISPDSLRADSFCRKEFEHAHANSKRIIPLNHRPVDDSAVIPALADYQRKDFPPDSNFDANFEQFLADLDQDPSHVREHTRLLTLAKEWQRSNEAEATRDRSLLLRGNDLTRAEQLIRNAGDKRPQFSQLQTQYVLTSRDLATRGRNKTLTAVSLALALTIALAIGLFFMSRAASSARDAENVARLAAEQERTEATKQRDLAEERRKDADTQRGIAQDKEKKAIAAAAAEREARNEAEERRIEAERQQKIAFAGQISAQSEVIRNQATIPTKIRTYQFANTDSTWPTVLQRSALLSVEGAKRYRAENKHYSLESAQALFTGLTHLSRSIRSVAHEKEVEEVRFSNNGSVMMAIDEDDHLRLWSVDNMSLVAQFDLPDDRDDSQISPDANFLVTSDDGKLSVLKLKGNLNQQEPLWSRNDAGEVSSLGFSDDEKILFTTNAQGVTLWSVTDGSKLHHLAQPGPIRLAVFSPSRNQLVTVGDDELAHIWNVSTGKELFTIKGESIYAIAYSPDETLIAVGDNNEASIWKASNGEKVKPFTGIPTAAGELEAIIYIRFSQDSKRLVLMGDEDTTQLWDIATGELQWVVGSSYASVRSGDMIIIEQPDGFEVWDPTTAKEMARVLSAGDSEGVAYEPQRKLFAVAKENQVLLYDTAGAAEEASITHTLAHFKTAMGNKYLIVIGDKVAPVWEVESARELLQLKHDGRIHAIAFSADEKFIATAGADQTLRIWEMPSGRQLQRITGIPETFMKEFSDGEDELLFIDKLVFSSSGKFLVLIGHDESARVWEVESGRELVNFTSKHDLSKFSFSRDEKYFATVGHRTTSVFEVATGKQLSSVEHKGASEVVFSPDGQTFATAGYSDNTARIWSSKTGKQVTSFTREFKDVTPHHDPNGINSVAFSADGAYLFSANKDNTARVWDLRRRREVARLPHGDVVGYVGLSPRGDFLISASNTDHQNDAGFKGTSDVYLWDIKKKRVWIKASHRDGVGYHVFSPDGKYFVSAGVDASAQLFDLTTRRRIALLEHDERVNSVEFSSDGKYIATASSDNIVRVWESRTGREVARMPHAGEVFLATFSKDGKRLSTASMDRTLRVWAWQPEDLITRVCDRLTRNLTLKEWRNFFGNTPYKKTCENLPSPSDAVVAANSR